MKAGLLLQCLQLQCQLAVDTAILAWSYMLQVALHSYKLRRYNFAKGVCVSPIAHRTSCSRRAV
jgi:hypothetical protein